MRRAWATVLTWALVVATAGAAACSDDVAAPTIGTGSAGGAAGGGAVASGDLGSGDLGSGDLTFADGGATANDAITLELNITTGDGGPIFLDVSLPETILPPPDSQNGDGLVSDLDGADDPDANGDGNSGLPDALESDGPAPDGIPTDGDGSAEPDGPPIGDGGDGGSPSDGSTVADTFNPSDTDNPSDTGKPSDAVLQGCESAKDCPLGWQCVKTPVGKICAEPACVPSSFEVCNGQDDDCNGDVDEGGLCNDGNACTTDSCGGKLGCKIVAVAGDTPCDLDANICTADVCVGGKCIFGKDKNCDDSNPCTFDLCSAGACQHKPQGLTACDDGNLCTSADKCVQGICQPGAPVSCNDGNPCTDDVCFPNTGKCLQANTVAGVPCSDGNACTMADKCALGQCSGQPANCDDGNPCSSDTCEPKLGCVHTIFNGAPCNDNNACTSADVCKNGVCGGGQQTCNDGNPCTLDGCNATGGCTSAPIIGACNDGNVCTVGEKCDASGCKGGTVQNCTDGNPCTDDVCDPASGCKYTANKGGCNDGNSCTVGEACQGGSCNALNLLDCNDKIPCTADTCDKALGGCLHSPKVEACDDGEVCTIDQCLTATGCKHTLIEKCCGGKQCGAGEACIIYPDTLQPFCAKTCGTGADCPTSCCHMTFKTKHCLVAPYLDQCCNTKEYWPTEPNPYGCGVGGKGKCVNYPNPQPPYYPSKIIYCTMSCTKNNECPDSCCGLTTLGSQQCVNPAYKQQLCPKF